VCAVPQGDEWCFGKVVPLKLVLINGGGGAGCKKVLLRRRCKEQLSSESAYCGLQAAVCDMCIERFLRVHAPMLVLVLPSSFISSAQASSPRKWLPSLQAAIV
jgi:hypothetical protein